MFSNFGLDASVPFAPLVHAEREGEADHGGRTCDDRWRNVDDDRKSLRCQFLNFRSLRSRRSRCGRDEPAGRAAQLCSRSRLRWYVKFGVGRTQSKLVEPVRATGRGNPRPRTWIGSGDRLLAPGIAGRARRDLFEHFFRKLRGWLFLYLELVLGGSGRSSLWLNIKITGFSATPPFSGASLSKLLPGAVPHNRRLSLYAAWRAPALSRGRDRAELPICG
jgi:hypothetical protein